MNFDHTTYISPLTWRYGSLEMRGIWSEWNKRKIMRQVWIALATAQMQAGLVTANQLVDLQDHSDDIDLDRALALEKVLRHDVVAEIATFAEQCPVGGGIIHLGATSADITDNVDALRLRSALVRLSEGLKSLLEILKEKILENANLLVMAFTHIQPAEPTTLGYRFAIYAQDLLTDFRRINALITNIKGKGFKGAVGTQAAFQELLEGTGISPQQMEAVAMQILDLPYYTVASQTYTRQQDLHIQQVLSGLGASLHKFALDFRVLQSPAVGEWAEPFSRKQVGSSAMPFKRNPVNSENICSLARYLAALPGVAWDNASQAILERSLDDSANRRIIQSEGFLIADELLKRAQYVLEEMVIDKDKIGKNLSQYGPFAATERVLIAMVKAGADRQIGHEWLRKLSLEAWHALQNGVENPLASLIENDPNIRGFLNTDQVRELMNISAHIGTAEIRAIQFAEEIRSAIA